MRVEPRIGDGDRAQAAPGLPDFLGMAPRHVAFNATLAPGQACSRPRDVL